MMRADKTRQTRRPGNSLQWLLVAAAAAALCVCRGSAAMGQAGAESNRAKTGAAAPRSERTGPEYETLTLRGRVVWMAEALKRRFAVTSVPEAKQRVLALECRDGVLYPLVEDTQGRAFRSDPRLRGIDVELLVRRYAGSPMVQVIAVYALEGGGKYELDYWCDVCAIATYELKPCNCCQGEVRLRRRKVREEGR